MFALVGWPGAVRGAMARPGVRAQALFILVLAILAVIIWQTAAANLSRLSVKSGYGFLFEPAPFEIGESLIPFNAGESTYLLAFVVGLLNTIKVAVLGILLSTLLGLVIALGQLSPSIMLARICRGYIEIVRNVPLLLQLIFWHTVLTRSLPSVRNAMSPIEGVYLTNRGLYLPAPVADPAYLWVGIAALVGLALAWGLLAWARRERVRTGQPRVVGRLAIALALLPPLVVFLGFGAPLEIDSPALKGFNFQGGMSLSPEFVAMLMGLTLYHAAFNAEIIRAGILGVAHGQTEAGLSLGLSRWQVTRMVVLPQALRIVIPPMSNSYLSLTKESSLAVAIGYPEIVRVANIAMASTNQAIECISIIMLVYLVLSLITAALLNWLNARARLVER
jgi:general L-amino acid transport system permease protein